jgi:haloalkane dehalogenase
MHYVDEGEGQPILMLHGNPTWSFLYRNVIRALRDRFRCIAVDYPGFGLSGRPTRYGYTPAEHAGVISELVHALELGDLIVMGHDWGGPIGTALASSHPDRVSGLVLGNTWFWPDNRRARMFGTIMSTRPLQSAIVHRNLFVERFLPAGINRTLSDEEMQHYRRVQPTPAARVGIAEFPRQLVAAAPMLADLEDAVRTRLRNKRVLITFPMRDFAFPPRVVLPRMRAAFADVEVVPLRKAKHFFLEDAPEDVARAISQRFASHPSMRLPRPAR